MLTEFDLNEIYLFLFADLFRFPPFLAFFASSSSSALRTDENVNSFKT